MATTATTEDLVLQNLYEFYHPNKQDGYGDPIYIKFTIGVNVEDGDIQEAREFAEKIRPQLGDTADVSQRTSTVIITPKV
jgi:hypothetical protein